MSTVAGIRQTHDRKKSRKDGIVVVSRVEWGGRGGEGKEERGREGERERTHPSASRNEWKMREGGEGEREKMKMEMRKWNSAMLCRLM